MAKILLNVEINEGTYKQQLAQMKGEIDKVVTTPVKTASMNVDSLQKSFANLLNTLKGTEGRYGVDTFKNLKTEISNCLDATKALKTEIGDTKPTKEQKQELGRLTKQYSELSAQFATVRVESEKLNTVQGTSANAVKSLQKNFANLINTLNNVKNKYPEGTFDNLINQAKQGLENTKSLNAEIGNSTTLNSKQEGRLRELSSAYQQVSADTATMRAETEQNNSAVIKSGDSITSLIKKFVQWQAAATIVMQTINLIRNAWNSVNETLVKTEDAVISLQRVAGSSANADELYDLAQRYGQTFENVYEISLNFARTGMDWADTIKATESALLALNVAELDATQASDGMIAIMQQFGKEASELTEIVDMLNITADNAAVTTEKLLTALQRTGSSAVNANLSLEETVGIITALSEATGRSGENIGTAINSLIQFSTKSSSLEVFEGLGGKVAETVEAYRHGSADVLDIWRELSTVIQNADAENSGIKALFGDEDWQSLNQELQDALGENFATVNEIYGTASTFRKNYFIALLNNLDQVDESLETMQNAQGYSQAENEQYLDTYTAKVNALQAKWQDIASDEQGLLGIKKILVDIGSFLLDITKWTGGIRTWFVALGGTLISIFSNKLILKIGATKKEVKELNQELTKTQKIANGFSKFFSWVTIISSIISLINGIGTQIEEDKIERISTSLENGTENLEKLSTKLNNIDKNYEDIIAKIKDYRAVLDDESSGQDEVTEAEKGLLEIQKDLLESNKDYKDGLDLINGALDDQIGKTEELAFTEKRKALEDFNLANADSAKSSKDYLFATQYTNTDSTYDEFAYLPYIKFNDSSNAWTADNTLQKYLKENGYNSALGSTSNLTAWDDFVSFFGVNNKQTILYGKEGQNLKDFVETILPNLQTQIRDDTTISEEDREEMLALIASTLAEYNAEGSDYKNALKFYYGDKDSDNIMEWLSLEQRERLYREGATEEIWNKLLTEWGFLKEETSSGSSGTGDTLIKTLDNLNDTLKEKILTELEALRSTEEKSNALEEKRQALENAKNQRTVRVFNAETGQWEQVANQKDIQKAEEAYEDEAYSQIKDLFNNKDDLSNESMAELLATIAETMPSIRDDVYKLLKEQGIELPAYDSGGVLSGLGGIKATTRDEIVLPPNIAEKILQPTSNEQFRNFTKSLGILFGVSERVGTMSPNSVIHNRGGDTINSNNGGNNTYINGVPITQQQAERYSVVELCEAMNLTNNN